MTVFTAPSFDDHEKVVFAADRASGLRAIIAVHDTRLGAAVGGCRMFPYGSDDEALDDVLRLSRGMTYKSALAGLPLGGGKSVIIGDPAQDKTPALWRAMAEFIESLGGRYVAAEDSGTAVADLRAMSQHTSFVSGFAATEHGGDPSPSTALGVYVAIRRALAHRLGASDLQGVRVAVQGLGHVGYALAELLVKAGARVLASDINGANIARAESELGVTAVAADDILFADVDVVAPCALGGALNVDSIAKLRAGIVAGAANNQLRDRADGARLADRGILYCPDFLINAGGIIDVHYQRSGLDRSALPSHIESIGDRLGEVLERADQCHQPTVDIAETLAEELLDCVNPRGEGLLNVA
ncbi:Glu/Leu/Phe/Val family dehydrogenase [Congregibacter litoralis]|uniref:Glutamate dehydrogenase/leucine dehydrogenase n=1 Tax=Congregibacter litoralis KT71 TaxID=314285 RepID=A4ACL0_9GAMM|nr:Glu/Leu/Phe/Val dehydrogenase dimerization domain-containing protein [Congregibacter litoralis]EAQ96224.1 Glutamate dehydrogenase/leucine dehydrogenase [Congregibacter litoralis KT71]